MSGLGQNSEVHLKAFPRPDIDELRSIGDSGLIVLKNSVFGKIREFFAHTARSILRYEGFGPIGLMPLIRELTASLGKSYLTFPYHGSFPKKHGI